MRKCRSLHFPFSAHSPITLPSEEVMVTTSNCGRLPSFPSAGPAPCSGAKRLLSSVLACPGPWLNLFPPGRFLGPDGLMGDLPGGWSRGTWGQSCTLLGGRCHLPPPLVARALGLALRCIFSFSYPLSKHFGFLPKYLGKIVYLWLLSPPMTHCNLAAAASPAPFMGERGWLAPTAEGEALFLGGWYLGPGLRPVSEPLFGESFFFSLLVCAVWPWSDSPP